MKNKKTSGFSIVLAMGLVLLLSFSSLYLLEYMVPFSRNIKGIENASQAFYEGYSGVEEGLLQVYSGGIGEDYGEIQSGVQVYEYSVIGSGSIIPIPEEGNSEYNSNWNRISQEEPISLLIGDDSLDESGGTGIEVYLRIPDLDNSGTANEGLNGVNEDFLLWQISSENNSLTAASGSLISENDIDGNSINLWGELGSPLSGSDETFSSFYRRECDDIGEGCVLKISVIRPLEEDSNTSIPYLEYQISIDSALSIPLSHSYISVVGKSYGFSKKLEVSVPQQATSSAFDFTVLQ